MGATAYPGACPALEYILFIVSLYTKIGSGLSLENLSAGKKRKKNTRGREEIKKEHFNLLMGIIRRTQKALAGRVCLCTSLQPRSNDMSDSVVTAWAVDPQQLCLNTGPKASIMVLSKGKRLNLEGHADIPQSCSAAGPSGREIKGLG